jgi:hypothetical protein
VIGEDEWYGEVEEGVLDSEGRAGKHVERGRVETSEHRTWLTNFAEDAGTADIVYNTTSSLWACCGYPDNTVSCQNPRLDRTFQAIAPFQFPYPSSSSSASSTPTKTSTSSATAASATGADITVTVAPSPAPSGLSTGATAGIAVGCSLLGLAVFGGAIFWFLRRRKRRGTGAGVGGMAEAPGFNEVGTPGYGSGTPVKGYYAPGVQAVDVSASQWDGGRKLGEGPRHEMNAGYEGAQLYGSERPQELP